MRATIHQPNYLPWRGFVEKARAADVLVLLDSVPFSKGSFTNRTRVQAPGKARGEWCWLTVPVERPLGLIRDVRVSQDRKWRHKHRQTLRASYKAQPGWAVHKDALNLVFARDWDLLCRLNMVLIGYLLDAYGVETQVVTSTELGAQGSRSELLADICRRVGATEYLSGASGPKYLDPVPFRRAGIVVKSLSWMGDKEPPLSALDALMRGEDVLPVGVPR